MLTADGGLVPVEGPVAGSEAWGAAYNLHIEEIHTYFVAVGDDEVLVHNKCVNLPSWRNRTGLSSRTIRDANNSGKRMQTQVEPSGATRVRIRGQGGGREIEMWVNTPTNVVETAYPR